MPRPVRNAWNVPLGLYFFVVASFRDVIAAAAAAPPPPAPEIPMSSGASAAKHLGDHALEITGSMVQAFLQKEAWSDEDKECLVKGSEDFAKNMMKVANHTVEMMEALMGHGKHTEFNVHVAASKPEEERRLGGLGLGSLLLSGSSILLELGDSLELLVKFSRHVASDCVSGEALDLLEEASMHARSLKFVAGHFLANGGDVVTELADAVTDYRKRDYEAFGTDLGISLRKMLLSKAKDNFVPEGQAGKEMLVNMSMGFVKGFFGEGFELDITLDKDPHDPLRIQMEACVANNLPFFEQIISEVVLDYMESEKKHKHSKNDGPGRAAIGTGLAMTAMELPDALKRCGLGREQAEMLMDSVKAFGAGMQLEFATRNPTVTNEVMGRTVGHAVEDWKKLDWYKFGYDFGLFFQELTLKLFSDKYSVDDAKRLRSQLSSVQVPHLFSVSHNLGATLAIGFASLLFVGLAVSLLVARRRRRRGAGKEERELLSVQSNHDLDEESILE